MGIFYHKTFTVVNNFFLKKFNFFDNIFLKNIILRVKYGKCFKKYRLCEVRNGILEHRFSETKKPVCKTSVYVNNDVTPFPSYKHVTK